MSIIGEKIKEFRQEKNLSQKALGNKAGMSQQMIAQYESGQRQPKIETLRRIANALEVELWEIVELDQMDETTRIQEIKNMLSQLTPEGLKEFDKLATKALNPDRQVLIDIYDKMTDSARLKVIAYAQDLWINPYTHKEIEE